jgi:hypothetical protein
MKGRRERKSKYRKMIDKIYDTYERYNFPTRRRRLLAFSFDSIKLGSLSTSF